MTARLEIPLFGTANKGASVRVSAQRRVNCYVNVHGEKDRATMTFHGMPGLDIFVNTGEQPARGAFSYRPTELAFYVIGSQLVEINAVGTVTVRGTLDTNAGRCSLASNGLQLMIVDGSYGYIYTYASTAFAKITDGDFPANPTTVVFHDGRFLATFAMSGRIYGSAIFNGASWGALDYFTAESNPDNVLAVAVTRGNLAVFGEQTTEFWGNIGGSGFPYARIQGVTSDWGLEARYSVANIGDTLFFLARRAGSPVVMMLNGYEAQKVSTTDIDYSLSFPATNTGATAFGWIFAGHVFYQITYTSGTLIYDATSNVWGEMQSFGDTRHRADMVAVVANEILLSDYANGNIYKVNPDNYSENGAILPFELVSRHLFQSDDMIAVGLIQVNGESGAASSSTNPQAMLQLSRDGGNSWGTEMFAPIGKTGEYKTRTIWRRLGRARDLTVRYRITDPVKRTVTSASAISHQGIA